MNQAKVTNLVSRLNYNYKPRHRNLRNIDGPQGRIRKIQKTLTAVLKYERIEVLYQRGDEVRGYVDRLISEAIRHGPTKETMELADFWILEKQLVHKLFKVLVPRFKDHTYSFTKLHKAPMVYWGRPRDHAVLELKGNPYPSLEQSNEHEPNLLHNLLLDAARKEFRLAKYQELAASLANKTELNDTATIEQPMQ